MSAPPAEPAAVGAAAASRAADAIRDRLGVARPAAGIILGSGLGALAERMQDARRIPFREIPGFPAATVAGHAGALIGGTLGGRPVVALAGRFHLYEGHPARLAAYPARLLHALGAPVLIVSNAAGGIRRSLRPGDLMLIADHINLMWRHPLIGAVETGEERFPDMSAPYDPELRARARAVALAEGIAVADGVYAAVLGPSYETAAEIRMLERMGADAVGMSTVPEVLVARSLGMRVLGISCITNLACGLSPAALSHAEVLETTARVAERFERLMLGMVKVSG